MIAQHKNSSRSVASDFRLTHFEVDDSKHNDDYGGLDIVRVHARAPRAWLLLGQTQDFAASDFEAAGPDSAEAAGPASGRSIWFICSVWLSRIHGFTRTWK